MRWRWDQGRLDYFRFENVKKIAKTLDLLDGVLLTGADKLRLPMEQQTGLPYSPRAYSVWRNYGRTFECAFLAAKIGQRLRTTEICKNIAKDDKDTISPDEYFLMLIRRFYLPFPAFATGNGNEGRIFPFCAIIRYLLSKQKRGEEASATLDEIFSFVVGNELRGNESLDTLAALERTDRTPLGDEKRQVREMIVAVSQCGFLEWVNQKICLDIGSHDASSIAKFDLLITPDISATLQQKGQEILRLGRIGRIAEFEIPEKETAADIVFTEGKKTARYHLMIERNGTLRKIFFERMRPPFICDVCKDAVNNHYPWVENILQIHHILPLSSPVKTSARGTLLNDLVPVCPNCQNAIHRYYRKWLNENDKDDFASDEEAVRVYAEAKKSYSRS